MIRRFNFTERKRIDQQRVAVKIEERNDNAPAFTAELDLYGLDLPPEANVIIEAYSGRAAVRFPWGKVRALAPPLDRHLTDMPVNPSFRVKVVAPDKSGVLLAMANRVRPHREEHHGSLVWLKGEDLGKEVWRLQFAGTGAPTLLVNENIHGIGEAVLRDGAFRGLVMPEVLRAMLTRALLVDDYSPEDDSGDWSELMVFVSGFYGEPIVPNREGDEREARMEWIDAAVAAFARHHFHASDFYTAALRQR